MRIAAVGIGCLLGLGLPVSLPASDARDQLDRFAQDLQSLSATFEQVTLDGNGRIVDESDGQLLYLAPDRFRWDYTDPFPQQMVADGRQIWHFDESLEQVTVRPQSEAGDSPLMVLTRPELLDRFYRVAPVDDPDLLEFYPLAENAEFEHAVLIFDAGLPAGLVLRDRFGQSTRLRFDQLVRNPVLDPERFRFEPPPGADVLEGY